MRKRRNLTARGRYVVIAGLTVLGCFLGFAATAIISRGCTKDKGISEIMACERKNSEYSGNDDNGVPPEIENLTPQWLFYQSYAKTDEGETKKYLDRLVNSWTKGKLFDSELSEQMTEYFRKQGIVVSTLSVQSQMLCLFPSANELPDYTDMLQKEGGIYDFIGVYTQGETDEEGRLICYYWEAGAR